MSDPTWIRRPLDAPPAHVRYSHGLGRGALVFEQMLELVKAINPQYVANKQGKAYLAQHQARAEMNRIFGYTNWDVDFVDVEPIFEVQEQGTGQNSGKTYWRAAYRGKSVVSIRDLWGMPLATIAGVHAEVNSNLPDRGEAHAMAITSLESYALRRALINLGDRFGLGLYNKGSMALHGGYTIQLEPRILFDWEQAGGQPTAATGAPQQLSHETIPAEPAAPEDWEQQATQMALEEPPVQQSSRPPAGQRLAAGQARVQQGNLQARIQAGMKQDNPGAVAPYPAPDDAPYGGGPISADYGQEAQR